MQRQTLTGFYESLTGSEERAVRVRFAGPFHALKGYTLMRAAQFRRLAPH